VKVSDGRLALVAWNEWSVPLGIGVAAAFALLVAVENLERDFAFVTVLALVFGLAGAMVVMRNREAFSLKNLALPAVALGSYLALIAIPSVFVFLDETGPGRYSFLVAALSVLVTFPLGVCLTNFWSGPDKVESAGSAATMEWVRLRRWWDIVFLFGIGVALLHVYQVGSVPISDVLSLRLNWLAAAGLREEAGHLLPGTINHYLFFWNRILVLPGLTILAVGAYRRQKSRTWLLRSVAAFFVGLFHGTFTLEKSFGMILFLVIGIFAYLDRVDRVVGQGRTKLRQIVTAVAAAFIFPSFILWWTLPDSGEWLDVAFSLGRRMLYVPAQVTYWYFDFVPHQMNFFDGATSRVMAFLTGQRFFDLANVLFVQEFGENNIATGSANACFVGSAWANFGWSGVLVEGLLAGVLVGVLYRSIRCRNDIFSKALHSLLIIPIVLGFTTVPIETVFLTHGVLLAVAAWFLSTRLVLLQGPIPRGAR
jgi:hypothetical protein